MAKKVKLTKSGTCKVCTINCYKEEGNKPSIWPCTVETCPYPKGQVLSFPKSSTGSSLLMITG